MAAPRSFQLDPESLVVESFSPEAAIDPVEPRADWGSADSGCIWSNCAGETRQYGACASTYYNSCGSVWPNCAPDQRIEY